MIKSVKSISDNFDENSQPFGIGFQQRQLYGTGRSELTE